MAGSISIHRCDCGKFWELKKLKSPVRDKDDIHCTCGRTIIEWNGGVMYIAYPLKDVTESE
jgi:hypothetical protein